MPNLSEPPNFARIYFEVPLHHGFDYRIPEHLLSRVMPGIRVLAPFGRMKKIGYVIDLLSQPSVKEVKEIEQITDTEPFFDERLLQLARWMSEYYLCPLGLVLKSMIPAPVRRVKKDPSKVIETFSLESSSENLEVPLVLSEEQKTAWENLSSKIQQGIFSVTLIHGVTGSGKTELYLYAIQEVLKLGKTALLLVPEISLTPQTIRRVRNRFGNEVALLHSRMTEKERISEWKRIRNVEARVVVGPRSALFSPVKKLGLVIVDEEHERSYKQEESPRYHARDVAIMRAKMESAVVLLGSATPSMESFYNARQGRYTLVSLTKRVEDRPLPKVRIVDMTREVETLGRLFSFSRSLINAVEERLKKKEQMILFLNRRGFSPMMLCPGCGYVLTCDECDHTLTYHQSNEKLRCHLCDHQRDIPKSCPKCGKSKFHRLGVGTQRVESHMAKLFPQARIQRMDTDSMRGKDAYSKVFGAFLEGQIDILVGTQMIAKGLDFPNVTLVGVMSADVAMSLPDFRMGEHTFQLLTQVAGRAGRGEKPGEVLIQTFTPMHPIIRAAVQQDYLRFYETELAYRHELGYPPFFRLILIGVEGKPEARVVSSIKTLAGKLRLKLGSRARILGPQPAPISKIKGEWRWQMILFYQRGKGLPKNQEDLTKNTISMGPIHHLIKSVLDEAPLEKGVRIFMDVDPVSLI